MAYSNLLFRDQARAKILAGASTLADAVRVTLGPRSRCVLIERKWGSPLVCDDGVTIAKAIRLKDPEENLGASMLREASVRTGEAVGDGTTTATVLAHAIFAEGLRNVVAGASAIDLKRGIERGLRVAVEALRGISKPVSSSKEKAQVASISAHGEHVGRTSEQAVVSCQDPISSILSSTDEMRQEAPRTRSSAHVREQASRGQHVGSHQRAGAESQEPASLT